MFLCKHITLIFHSFITQLSHQNFKNILIIFVCIGGPKKNLLIFVEEVILMLFLHLQRCLCVFSRLSLEAINNTIILYYVNCTLNRVWDHGQRCVDVHMECSLDTLNWVWFHWEHDFDIDTFMSVGSRIILCRRPHVLHIWMLFSHFELGMVSLL